MSELDSILVDLVDEKQQYSVETRMKIAKLKIKVLMLSTLTENVHVDQSETLKNHREAVDKL